EYKCIADIARYLARTVIHHSEKSPMATLVTVLENTERGKGRERCRPSAKPRHSPSDQLLDIAIIGVSAKYPRSENMAQVWDNLKQGKR
ncbi:hypothetical protein KKI93_25730, partial [Xenorhabdus bovienii]|uniref:hypothetical protein n=1 Tax=Xenorhabdus bovienii TaxID=40576 RepID=UPI0023B2D776